MYESKRWNLVLNFLTAAAATAGDGWAMHRGTVLVYAGAGLAWVVEVAAN